ncbi:hypothetical protein BJV78DRAFT_911870 [Lactifluus subvellereus]|nr:hypothetical protein BJV78DRAFT_911870 [Lactifluus subvellereus]
MKLTTATLLPFAPHQEQISSTYSSQRALVHSKLPSLFNNSLPCAMSSPSPRRLIDVPLRPNSLRNRPSVISKSSCESSSSSSSSFPDTSPTSYSTPPSSLPPSPPPPSRSSHSSGKSRPLPQPPKFPQPPPPNSTSGRLPLPNPADAPGHLRPRSPPPAWSPPGTPSEPAPPPARPMRPRLVIPPLPQQRQSGATPDVRSTPAPPQTSTPLRNGPISSPRVRRLPMRPVPPGPPSEVNTPVAPFARARWPADSLTIPEDDTPDDQRAIDWDLIDEVMMHAS